jgi:hypothetical protein
MLKASLVTRVVKPMNSPRHSVDVVEDDIAT